MKINIIYKNSLLFKINLLIISSFLTLVVFNIPNFQKNNEIRSEVSKKFKKVEIILEKYSINLLNKKFQNEVSYNFVTNYFINQNDKIIKNFGQINMKVSQHILYYKDIPFIKLKIKLNLSNNQIPDSLVFIGFFKKNKTSDNPFKRWPYFRIPRDCNLKNNQSVCNLNINFIWYCITDRDRYLPDEFKYLASQNISSRFVPFQCRW